MFMAAAFNGPDIPARICREGTVPAETANQISMLANCRALSRLDVST